MIEGLLYNVGRHTSSLGDILFVIAFFFFAFAFIYGWLLSLIASKAKKRDARRWFLIGFFAGGLSITLGSLIFITLLLLPSLNPTNGNATLVSHRKCPYCSERIPSDARVCRSCNRTLI